MAKGLVLAGTHSGVGKTTVSLALMAALKRRGIDVQAFKVGPDFIDPGHHAQVIGRPSHNLDGWMMPRGTNLQIFSRYSAQAEVVVVEGVMGLYDGYNGQSEAGSTAQMAKWLGLPVLLCVNARSMARSLAAIVLGFARFDPDISWVGALANRVGSPRHAEMIKDAVGMLPDMELIGLLDREPNITMAERHLGLVTADEQPLPPESRDRLADWIESGLNIDRLLDSLPEIEPPAVSPVAARSGTADLVTIGVARDEAFCFYYQENIRLLEEAGARIKLFSPLHDSGLPENLDGIYLGGGYPELFAPKLSENDSMRAEILDFGRSGKPMYAECGGFMYLTEKLEDLEGRNWPMVNLFPIHIRMLSRLRSLGYRQVTLDRETPLGPAGLTARGHEFHYSEIIRGSDFPSVYSIEDRTGQPRNEGAGFLTQNVLASYVHLHFGSHPDLAAHFAAACRRTKKDGTP